MSGLVSCSFEFRHFSSKGISCFSAFREGYFRILMEKLHIWSKSRAVQRGGRRGLSPRAQNFKGHQISFFLFQQNLCFTLFNFVKPTTKRMGGKGRQIETLSRTQFSLGAPLSKRIKSQTFNRKREMFQYSACVPPPSYLSGPPLESNTGFWYSII